MKPCTSIPAIDTLIGNENRREKEERTNKETGSGGDFKGREPGEGEHLQGSGKERGRGGDGNVTGGKWMVEKRLIRFGKRSKGPQWSLEHLIQIQFNGIHLTTRAGNSSRINVYIRMMNRMCTGEELLRLWRSVIPLWCGKWLWDGNIRNL